MVGQVYNYSCLTEAWPPPDSTSVVDDMSWQDRLCPLMFEDLGKIKTEQNMPEMGHIRDPFVQTLDKEQVKDKSV